MVAAAHFGGEFAAVRALLEADTSGANGDDGSIVRVPGGLACISVDMSLEGVHLHSSLTPREMGWRACAVALSDLAAMAAVPNSVVSAIGVPHGKWHDVEAITAGVRECAASSGAQLVGGDLVADQAGRWSISITCVGSIGGSNPLGPVTRAGAREGDALYVTGSLGASAAAVRLLQAGAEVPDALLNSYIAPAPRHRVARAVARLATSMIDISDGIAGDVRHLATSSRVGMSIDLALLPVHPAAKSVLARDGDPAEIAAQFGDDYELLFSAPPAAEPELRAIAWEVDPGCPITRVGVCGGEDVTFTSERNGAKSLYGFEHG